MSINSLSDVTAGQVSPIKDEIPTDSQGDKGTPKPCHVVSSVSTSTLNCGRVKETKSSYVNNMSTILNQVPKLFQLKDISIEERERVLVLTRSLVLPILSRVKFTEHEFRCVIKHSLQMSERIASFLDNVNTEFKYIKYHLSVLMCKLFKDTQRPDGIEKFGSKPLFSGILRRVINRAIARRDTSLIYSLDKCKNSWPRLSVESLIKTLQDHRMRWSSKESSIPFDVETEIGHTAKRLFLQSGPGEVKFFPSGSACLEANRDMGGVLSLFPGLSTDGEFTLSLSGEQKLDVSSQVLNCRLDNWRAESLEMATFETLDSLKNPSAFDLCVIPLFESGKIRIITKGSGFLNAALQPIQGKLVEDWKKCKHSTMRDEDLTLKVQKLQDDAPSQFPYFISGDYEAATDWLKKTATDACLLPFLNLETYVNYNLRMNRRKLTKYLLTNDEVEEMISQFSLAYRSFRTHEVRYPSTFEGTRINVDPFIPRNGQPMGHPLSFPLLCTINLAVYRCSLKKWAAAEKHEPRMQTFNPEFVEAEMIKYNKEYKEWLQLVKERKLIAHRLLEVHDVLSVIINGDDILFKADEELFEIFKEVSYSVGLRPSNGKNFKSFDHCMINSQIFALNKENKITRKYYLNQKIVFGIRREGEPLPFATELSRPLNDMFKNLPWSQNCIKLILAKYDKLFQNGLNFTPNWFLPTHLGGFGIDPINFGLDKKEIRYTKQQRVMAARFIHNPKLALSRTIGAPRAAVVGNLKETISMYPVHLTDEIVKDGRILFSEQEGSWSARMMMINRLVVGSKPLTDVNLFQRIIKAKHSRFAPMGDEKLFEYWDVTFASSILPPVPDLGPLPRLTDMLDAHNLLNYRRIINPYNHDSQSDTSSDESYNSSDEDIFYELNQYDDEVPEDNYL